MDAARAGDDAVAGHPLALPSRSRGSGGRRTCRPPGTSRDRAGAPAARARSSFPPCAGDGSAPRRRPARPARYAGAAPRSDQTRHGLAVIIASRKVNGFIHLQYDASSLNSPQFPPIIQPACAVGPDRPGRLRGGSSRRRWWPRSSRPARPSAQRPRCWRSSSRSSARSIGQMHGLTDDVRDLTRETRREVERIGEVTEHVRDAPPTAWAGSWWRWPDSPAPARSSVWWRAFAAASTCSCIGCEGIKEATMADERNDAAGYLGWFLLGGVVGRGGRAAAGAAHGPRRRASCWPSTATSSPGAPRSSPPTPRAAPASGWTRAASCSRSRRSG